MLRDEPAQKGSLFARLEPRLVLLLRNIAERGAECRHPSGTDPRRRVPLLQSSACNLEPIGESIAYTATTTIVGCGGHLHDRCFGQVGGEPLLGAEPVGPGEDQGAGCLADTPAFASESIRRATS